MPLIPTVLEPVLNGEIVDSNTLEPEDKYTVAVGLAYFNGQFDVKMNLLMAASVVCMLPVVILFFFAQRAFVEGISLTGIKG